MRKQSTLSGFTRRTPPTAACAELISDDIFSPVPGMKRTAGSQSVDKVLENARQRKFRKLIGDGESKDTDAYK